MSNQLGHRGKEWLEKLLDLSGLSADVKVTDGENSGETRQSYWLTIDETQLTSLQIHTLIGPKGEVLDAIQYLANSILNLAHEEGDQAAYTVELGGYRRQRQEELQSLATRAAQQVRATGGEVELTSLSSAERRQIHTFLQDCDDLETQSRGQEPDRRLVIRLR
ncbi:MAG TPA: RNA-binding protein [Cyanobacteria bacterium UBA11149]|nr:RNA-binding protein [Cyanobacteria bacterium UBA11367]HBE59445.1 RNA-binding protein [Cyanobacteria bacterium UBA11366]HBK65304.1 RNA-binding protein [Cyanobacteria bacterium UBA11166]HBR76335.1 RNA-binding protein [Cyanobacteria bacterium UBA11159]HBS72448.1 RNA-binding protein [Cyanobacteria bacterium UBA11153]HBW89890.1 RNA-binding protein [Cyanobacteria bacterium UBA11149]HCA97603.1 RNA-binding protein [Cyanobacteria bacterium UBA9226]